MSGKWVIRRRVLVLVLLLWVPMPVLFALLLSIVTAAPALASERTFAFSPADLAHMIDEFNAGVLARSGTFTRRVTIHGDAVRFFGRSCPTLSGDGIAGVTRVRVLDGAARAGAMAKRGTPDFALAAALQSFGAAAWTAPADVFTKRPAWLVETGLTGAAGFTTAGFATGDPTGKIDPPAATERTPSFLVGVDLNPGVMSEPTGLVLALTSELPPSRPGKMPKRSECFLVATILPADVDALAELLAAATLPDLTRSRLNNILGDARAWLAEGKPLRAARATKRFALEVASRSASEIAAGDAEALIMRALKVTDALAF